VPEDFPPVTLEEMTKEFEDMWLREDELKEKRRKQRENEKFSANGFRKGNLRTQFN
jgi:hypothetical protein